MTAILGVIAFASLPLQGQGVADGAPAVEIKRSISASGQFRVFGISPVDRGTFCDFSERMKEDLAKVLRLKGTWNYPVVIQLHTQAPVSQPSRFVVSDVRPTAEGFRFQVDVLLAEGFGREEMSAELLRVLLLEKMLEGYSGSGKITREGRLPPYWLQSGLLELVRYRQEGTPNDLFSSIVQSNRVLPIEELLDKDPTSLSSVSRSVFGASAAGLVRALLKMDSGAQRLVAFMEQLPGHAGDQAELLKRVFPGLARSRDSLEKWWSLELASMGRPSALDFLDPEETQVRLQEVLTVRYEKPVQGKLSPEEEVICHVSDLDQLLGLKKEHRAEVLAKNELMLLKLSLEAFPAYRALIGDYRFLVSALRSGKSHGLKESFELLETSAYAHGQMLRDIEDYINWYEGAKLSEVSGAFKDYKDALRELETKSPLRRDRISEYLDRFEEKSDN